MIDGRPAVRIETVTDNALDDALDKLSRYPIHEHHWSLDLRPFSDLERKSTDSIHGGKKGLRFFRKKRQKTHVTVKRLDIFDLFSMYLELFWICEFWFVRVSKLIPANGLKLCCTLLFRMHVFWLRGNIIQYRQKWREGGNVTILLLQIDAFVGFFPLHFE